MLVAISIPIFTSQLEKSKEATDAANIRAAYAEVMADAITSDTSTITKKVTLKQKVAGWQNSFDFPANMKPASGAAQPTGNGTQEATITYKPSAEAGKVADSCEIDILLVKAS